MEVKSSVDNVNGRRKSHPEFLLSQRSVTRTKLGIQEEEEEEAKIKTGELLTAGLDFEDKLFDVLSEQNGCVRISKFNSILHATGLRDSDPRLKEATQKFAEIEKKHAQEEAVGNNRGYVDKQQFKECVTDNVVIIAKALKNQFVIPDWKDFCNEIEEMYEKQKMNKNGKPANYIPQLGRADPSHWGVSVCTVDGQRLSLGNANVPFCIQSMVKPLSYALVLNDLTQDVVHKYVGHEPSGRSFNELTLNYEHKPHNPMINSGAIVVSSLLKKELNIADRFEYIMNELKRLSGGEHISFNNSVYLSERATADRNFALGYYMRENKCFPEGVDLHEVLEFYFQLCSVEITCDSGATIAATLANGGICPQTGDKVLDAAAVRNTLSLMHSCGMYDYSGQFAFKVGLPAKSGVAGGVMLVVPNVMGIMLWSPPLDNWGNSYRGVAFCQDLVSRFNFHNYDNLKHTEKKKDPRARTTESKAQDVVNLLFSAFNGDVTAMRRYALLGMDMSLGDYDGRTALHLGAAEGHLPIVKFVLERCQVNPYCLDRWGFTPLDDAKKFGHEEVAAFLEDYMRKHPQSDVEQITGGIVQLGTSD